MIRLIKNFYMNLRYESRDNSMKFKVKNKISKDKYIVNGNEINKREVIKVLSDWARKAFIFQNHKVHLPHDTEVPVKNVDEELVDLNVFDKTGMDALDYLITCILAVGIKIGREMEQKERDEE